MQYRVISYILFALIIVLLSYCYFFQNRSNEKVITSKHSDIKTTKSLLENKIKQLELENKLLKDQVFQLEKQQYLFKSTPLEIDKEKYNLEENLKFKNEDEKLKENIEELNDINKDEDYKINPSIDFNQETRSIDGVKIEVETKF